MEPTTKEPKSEKGQAVRDRLDDAKAALVPLMNDAKLREKLTQREVAQLMRATAQIIEVREAFVRRTSK